MNNKHKNNVGDRYNYKILINIYSNQKSKYFLSDIMSAKKAIILNIFKEIIKYIKILAVTFKNKLKEATISYNSYRMLSFNKNKNNNNTSLLVFPFFILINILILANSQNIKIRKRKIFFSNEITIKILNNEKKNILNSQFNSKPEQIYVNEISFSINSENEITNLPEGENNIRMLWNSLILDCSSMFKGLDNIIEVDLSKFDSSQVTLMTEMFADCTNVRSIIFDDIETSSVTDMSYLFSNCESLISIDLSRINTKSLQIMNDIFSNCKKLISVDLSNFNTSIVTSMACAFTNCNSIKTIDLSSFNTRKVDMMMNMFENCHELISLDISNFDTTNVYNMDYMFNNCYKLSYINLSNIQLSSVNNAEYFLSNCTNLEFIDFTNFRESPDFNKDNIFEGIPDNFSYCINNIDENPIIMELINNKNCTIKDCSNIWKIKQKKIISEKNKCVYDCIEDENYPFTFKNKCYDKCPYGTYISNEEDKICSIECTEELPFAKNDECFED